MAYYQFVQCYQNQKGAYELRVGFDDSRNPKILFIALLDMQSGLFLKEKAFNLDLLFNLDEAILTLLREKVIVK